MMRKDPSHIPHRLAPAGVLAGVGVAQNGFKIRLKNGSDQWLLVLKLKGRSRFTHSTGVLYADPGTLVAIQPRTPHDYGVDDGGPTLGMFASFNARPHWLEWLNWPEVSPGLHHLHIDDPTVLRRVTASFRRATKLADLQLPLRDDLTMNALEQVLMWCYMVNPNNAGTRLDPRVRQAIEYLSSNADKPVSITALAEACHISTSFLFPLFRKQVGVTPLQFLEQQRLNRAMKLLRMTNDPIGNIATTVGFADPFHFSTRFKKHVGQSPRDFRRGGQE